MLAFESGTGPGSTLCLLKILATSVLYICGNYRGRASGRASRWFKVVHQHAKRPAFTSLLIVGEFSISDRTDEKNTSAFFEVFFSLLFWNGSVMSKNPRGSSPAGPF